MGIESPVHLIFIGLVALIVLGPKRLPELARALGQGIREFRGAIDHAANPPESADPYAAQPAPLQLPAAQPAAVEPAAVEPAAVVPAAVVDPPRPVESQDV